MSENNHPPHERLLLGLSEEEYQQWRHNPVTAAYLRYLGDLHQGFRTSAADLLEAGNLGQQSDVIRGRLINLRELQSLTLGDIQRFYRQEEDQDSGTKAD